MIIIVTIITCIFIQELSLQHVMLLSTSVLVKLNGIRKKENSKNLTYYEKIQKPTLILIELLTTAMKTHYMNISNCSTRMFLEKLIKVTERVNLSDVNRQFIINFSTHEAKGPANIFSLNAREFCVTNVSR